MRQNLEQRLGRYAHPNPANIETDLDRAWEHIQANAKYLPTTVISESPRPRSWRLLPAAAAVVFAIVLSILFWPVGSAATVVAADSGLYRLVSGQVQPLKVGERVSIGQTLRSEGMASATLEFTDGSRVEMNSMSEIALENGADGFGIRVHNGSVIANTEKLEAGRRLYVATRDITVPVVGVLLVKADDKGSSVGAIKGETSVKPNQKLDDLALALEIGWSREAAAYLAMMHESVAQKIAAKQSATPAQRGIAAASKPQFDVASIRKCEQDFQAPEGMRGGASNSLRLSPGRLDAVCMTPSTLIRTVFRDDLKNNQGIPTAGKPQMSFNTTYGLGKEDGTRVRGGPDWIRSEHYSISAVAETPFDAQKLAGPMLLNLFEQRFQLKYHIATEEIPVWALEVAKGGLKIKPVAPGSCFPMPVPPPPTVEEFRQLEKDHGPICGNTTDGTKRSFVGVSMSALATELSQNSYIQQRSAPDSQPTPMEGLLVINRTGIADSTLFDFTMNYVVRLSSEPGPAVFEAVEKLGLKLTRAKDTREYVVIDHIERPSEN
jgi:uncharacterized protein (TIGR03435 family)